MKKAILSSCLAVLFNLSLYADYTPSTTIFQSNVKVLDDATTTNIDEGILVVGKNIFLPASSFDEDTYYGYSGYGAGNIFLGCPGGWSSSTKSILMGSGYFSGAINSILMGNGYSSSTSSILMGNGYLYGENSILMGTASCYSSNKSIIAGNSTVGDLTDSIALGGGFISSAYRSIICSSNSSSISYLNNSIAMLNNTSIYNVSDSILFGAITANYAGASSSFFMGTMNIDNDKYYRPRNTFMMGTNLSIVPSFDYNYENNYIDNIFSFGKGNITTVPASYLIGEGLKTEFAYSLVIGRYNLSESNNLENWADPLNSLEDTDPVFVVGNGTSNASRSNAFTVRRNGNTEVAGEVKAQKFITTVGSGGIPMGEFGRPTN
ncbi:MAG: hypothetical protein J6P03_00225 [Opitutales bacterium]|nr:hypothetical protein [Opitutales bacterium]